MDVSTFTSGSAIFDFDITGAPTFAVMLYQEQPFVLAKAMPIRTHLMSSSGLHPHQPIARWLATCFLAIAGDEKMPVYCRVTRMETEDADGNGTLDGFVSIDPTKLPAD